MDQFGYACGLRNGQVLEFEEARIIRDAPACPDEIHNHNAYLELGGLPDDDGDAVAGFLDGGSVPCGAQWVELRGVKIVDLSVSASRVTPYFNFERGLVVRISEIVWVADAPHGS